MGMSEKVKVTVHSWPWVTGEGHSCLRWSEYWVVIGANPLGPRGGRHGNVVNGHRVGKRFRRYEDALDSATELAAQNNYELI